MKERQSYIGSLKGVKGVWCDKKPRGLDLEKTITFYVPDEGKVFTKDGELFDSVVLKDGEKIKDYKEVERPMDEKGE